MYFRTPCQPINTEPIDQGNIYLSLDLISNLNLSTTTTLKSIIIIVPFSDLFSNPPYLAPIPFYLHLLHHTPQQADISATMSSHSGSLYCYTSEEAPANTAITGLQPTVSSDNQQTVCPIFQSTPDLDGILGLY
jgi:hypothetical protein